MIRKIYIDLCRRQLAELDLGWLWRVAVRYPLVLLSSRIRRPLCGPILGTIVTNYSCNCSCTMCDLPAQDRGLRDGGHIRLETQRLKTVIEQFGKIGVLGVGFTGGEPLLHPDILPLLKHCRRLGMLTHLNTNGMLLDDNFARELVRIGVDSVNVSLDGARVQTHDAIRGVPGAFDGATGAIRRILSARGDGRRPRVKAVMVVQEENIEEIQEVARLAANLGADCVEYIPEQPFGRGGARVPDPGLAAKAWDALKPLLRSAPLPIENSPRMMRLIPWTMRCRTSPLRCFAGYNSITVDCYGRVFPCLPWLNWDRNSVLSAPEDLVGLWRSDAYGRRRLEASICRDCTLNCQAELNLLFNPLRRIKPR